MNRKKSTLILISIFWALLGGAQIPGMRKYTQLDGFNASTGYTINQDERGYIWIGTDNGGICFDGKKFTELQKKHKFVNSEILECWPFTHNKIALIPFSGNISFLDHDTIIDSNKDPRLKKEKNRKFNYFNFDVKAGAGWLWDLQANSCLYRFTKTEIDKFCDIPSDFTALFVIDNYVIGSNRKGNFSGFCNSKSLQIHPFYYRNQRLNDKKEPLLPLSNSNGIILTYVENEKKLNVYRWKEGDSILNEIASHYLSILPPYFSRYSAQKKQYLFFGLNSKRSITGYCADITTKNVPLNVLKLEIPGILNSFFVDKDNNVWITSSNNALYFLSEKHINNALAVQKKHLNEKIPKSISGHGHKIFLSYVNSNELTILSGAENKVVKLNKFFFDGGRKILGLNDTSFLIYSKDVALVNIKNGETEYLGLPNTSIKDVCEYEKGFLVATHGEIFYSAKNHRGRYQSSIVFKNRATSVKVLSGYILIGTPDGLYRKKGIEGNTERINHPSLNEAYITDMTVLDKDNLLISTNGKGLFIYNTTRQIKPLNNNKDSPIPKHIRQLYQQDSNSFWAATDEGACCFTLSKKGTLSNVKNYTFYDGLPSDNVTSIYTYHDTAYIATAEGLGIIPLKDSSVQEIKTPAIYINSLQADNLHFLNPEHQIKLLYNQNNLFISLSGISFESLGNMKYSYRLTPYQNEWIETSEPETRFSHLPPGNYIFEAYTTNAKNVKSKIVQLRMFIKPAFWQTLFFKTSIILVAIVLLFMIIRWQLRKTEKRRYLTIQQKKHFAELELEAIKAQINPHFIYNCLNSIQYLNYKADYEQAQQYLSIFSRLIRMTMQYSQKVFITIDEEVDYLSNYLQMEQLRFKDKLNYTIKVDGRLNKSTSLPAMLLQPYVENALKHGIAGLNGGGVIHISFRKAEESLEIIIRDNGPGFSSLQTDGTLGLRLSATRALSYNELFNIHVKIECFNEQDADINKTGAIIKITITPTKNGQDKYKSGYHR